MTDTIPTPDADPVDIQCIVHMTDWDPDCKMCKAELNELAHIAAANADANRVIEGRLRSMGGAVSITNILSIRLNTLIESACGGNPKTKAKFEQNFMANMAAALTKAEEQAVRARLMQGVRPGRQSG